MSAGYLRRLLGGAVSVLERSRGAMGVGRRRCRLTLWRHARYRRSGDSCSPAIATMERRASSATQLLCRQRKREPVKRHRYRRPHHIQQNAHRPASSSLSSLRRKSANSRTRTGSPLASPAPHHAKIASRIVLRWRVAWIVVRSFGRCRCARGTTGPRARFALTYSRETTSGSPQARDFS